VSTQGYVYMGIHSGDTCMDMLMLMCTQAWTYMGMWIGTCMVHGWDMDIRIWGHEDKLILSYLGSLYDEYALCLGIHCWATAPYLTIMCDWEGDSLMRLGHHV
jgi:hypothetical protein